MDGARVGRLINGKYRIQRVLGEGGMGIVFAARNEQLGRDVAIKFLLAHATHQPELVARFLHEARAAAALRHPNVVDVLDVDTDVDGTPFIVLELLEGEPLSAVLKRIGALSVEQARSVLLPVMDGIALAHDRGIVHRDIKPENIFLHRDARGGASPRS